MAFRRRLAATLAVLGALVTATLVVRGWLALRDLLNPPQLTFQDLAFQLSGIALPVIAAFLIVVRRAAAGAVLLVAYGAMQLPSLVLGLTGLAENGVAGQTVTEGLRLGEASLLVAAGIVAWTARSGRVRAVRSRTQPVLWLAAVAVAAQAVFPSTAPNVPAFADGLRPAWFEPQLLQGDPAHLVSNGLTVLLVAGLVGLAAAWPRDVAAGAYMGLAVPVLLGGVATLTRALSNPELEPTVWAWIVPAGAAVLVVLATWWWNQDDAAEPATPPPPPPAVDAHEDTDGSDYREP